MSVQAQNTQGLATGFADSRTLKTQRKVEELFESGEYDRAYFIYRHELVPLGDKYAQYMVGFMHLTGKGVEEDPIVASAWYRLAAERGTPEFVAVRGFLLATLTDQERASSDVLFSQFRREFSDMVVLLASIKRGVKKLGPTTGSRLSGRGSPVTVIEGKSLNQARSGSVFRHRAKSDVEGHLMMLAEIGGFSDMETDPSRVDINDIEELVNEKLQAPFD